MTSGRKPRVTPRINWLVRVDQPTANEIDLILLDPTKLRVRYGTRSDLINQLLTQWLMDVKAGKESIVHLTG